MELNRKSNMVLSAVKIKIMCVGFCLLVQNANSAPLTIPHQFFAGEKAEAEEVNQNFDAIDTSVNDNHTRVSQNAFDIATNLAKTLINETDIATNLAKTLSNESDIADNLTEINNNASQITTNIANIATNATTISANSSLGAVNRAEIIELQGNYFGSLSAPCLGNDGTDIMVRVGPLCIDKYEASVWTQALAGGDQLGAGVDDYGCSDNGNDCLSIFARSEVNVHPAVEISWFQAQRACANSGKRLLTNAEWQMAAFGIVDPDNAGSGSDGTLGSCNTSNGAGAAGAVRNTGGTACESSFSVADMVGNVSEWVADWIQGSSTIFNPAMQAAMAGYNDDLMSGVNSAADTNGIFPSAIIRGGSFADVTLAGIFSFSADHGPDKNASQIGFRCAR